jgi:hypothetical protein
MKWTALRDWDGIKMKVFSPNKIREGLAILNKRTSLSGSIFFKKKISFLGGFLTLALKGLADKIGLPLK